jgi:16S rRNA (uracil1498-N3)-methyltransferase
MRKIRVYVAEELSPGALVRLEPFAAEHLTRVLRLPDGAAVTCFNGDGNDYSAELHVAGRAAAAVAVGVGERVDSEPALAVTLVQGIARGERMDSILQKATELGAAAIVPVVSERTEVRLDEERAERRLAHWQRVLQSACEQCGRARVPSIDPPRPLVDYIAATADDDTLRLCLHPEAGVGLQSIPRPSDRVVLAVGPEGGFGDRDLDAMDRAGYRRITLGPRILRTETAGPAALAAVMTLWGDLA